MHECTLRGLAPLQPSSAQTSTTPFVFNVTYRTLLTPMHAASVSFAVQSLCRLVQSAAEDAAAGSSGPGSGPSAAAVGGGASRLGSLVLHGLEGAELCNVQGEYEKRVAELAKQIKSVRLQVSATAAVSHSMTMYMWMNSVQARALLRYVEACVLCAGCWMPICAVTVDGCHAAAIAPKHWGGLCAVTMTTIVCCDVSCWAQT